MTKPQSGNILKNSGETEQKTQGEIWDENGKQIPVDFVNTGNNHHVAIYRKPVLDKKGQVTFDEDGNLMYELDEVVVSFFEAVTRANLGLPIIDKDYRKSEGWQFLFSMKQNEYFVFPNDGLQSKGGEFVGSG